MKSNKTRVLLICNDDAIAARVSEAWTPLSNRVELTTIEATDPLPALDQEQPFDIWIANETVALAALATSSGAAGREWPLLVVTDDQQPPSAAEKILDIADDHVALDELTPSLLDRILRYAIDRRNARTELEHLSKTDLLTNSANRVALYEFTSQAIARARRHNRQIAVLHLNIDHFQMINEAHGYAFGDRVLAQFASVLKRNVRQSDLVARLGNDEFVIVLDDIVNREAAQFAADKLREAVRLGFDVDGNDIKTEVALGVAVWRDDAGSTDELLSRATREMKSQQLARRQARGSGLGAPAFG